MTPKEAMEPTLVPDLVAHAIKALSKGVASEQQQKIALEWIVVGAARTNDDPFVPGHPDLTNHLLGRRRVGLDIVGITNMKMKNPNEENNV